VPTHARHAVPWQLVLTSSLLILVMLVLLGRWPGALWPLGGVAVGALAGSIAWSLDEPVPEIADAAARPLHWRLASAGIGVVVVVGAWIVGVAAAGDLLGRQGHVLGHGLAAAVAVSGGVAWLRSRGHDHPGRVLAPYLVLIVAGLALAQPLAQQLPVFPHPGNDSWAASSALWVVLAALGALALSLSVIDLSWRRIPHHPPRGSHG
jgi:hypothetical protein